MQNSRAGSGSAIAIVSASHCDSSVDPSTRLSTLAASGVEHGTSSMIFEPSLLSA